MENDLLFTLSTKPEWKDFSSSGNFEPSSLKEIGYIRCYQGSQIEDAANNFETTENELLLIVIDPLRIQVPIKNQKQDGEVFPNLYGAFSIDAVIDRILLKKSKKGVFAVHVKHFD
ncbi:MAG: DUF952 domain-containing protein [Balneolaceae bacterium]